MGTNPLIHHQIIIKKLGLRNILRAGRLTKLLSTTGRHRALDCKISFYYIFPAPRALGAAPFLVLNTT